VSGPRYALDDRTAAAIIAELRTRATAEDVPGLEPGPGSATPTTWADVLFPGGVLNTSEPSGALLDAVAELYPGLLRHLSALPDRALVDWLERRLGISRLPIVPDRVVAVPTPDPKQLPVVVPAGTALRGGRDVAGNERRYVTTETLTVLGTTLDNVRSYRFAPEPAGESRNEWTKREAPFEPFPLGIEVPHYADIASVVLAFEGGDAIVGLRFAGRTRSLPAGLRWSYSTPAGLVEAIPLEQRSDGVRLRLSGSCTSIAGDPEGLPFIRVALPEVPYPAGAFEFSFTNVVVQVERFNLKPDAGFYNDGIVDITKEFQPFGPVPRRGDSFYLQSEEAFGKSLAAVGVEITVPVDVQLWKTNWGDGISDEINVAIAALQGDSGKAVRNYFGDKFIETGDAQLDWQAYDGATWVRFDSASELRSIPISDNIAISPSRFAVAGVSGHMIRAFLNQGDFGWTDYQNRVATFAAEAAKPGGSPKASDLIPPDPPLVSQITISYRTTEVGPAYIRSVNGWWTQDLKPGDKLFDLPLPVSPPANTAGEIGFGLELPGSALGAVISLFVDIDPAAACGDDDVPEIAWECWTAFGWVRLDAVDGTTGLRQAGLLRFVAPGDWKEGCPEFSTDSGRWLRIVTDLPDRLGTIRAIVADAITAEYRSLLPDPTVDPTPEVPLGPRELKGLTVPIVGIKKMSNPLAGSVGRGPEPDPAYMARAADRTRHRNRTVQAWDYEAIVRAEFPEVATVRCLPHTGSNGDDEPGVVGLVIVPWSDEPHPVPSVTLAERILAALRGRTPVHARPVVLCPLYQGVSVQSKAVLRPGYSAAEAKRTLGAAIDAYLHPGADAPFGRELFASTLVRFLESRPEVDHVTTFLLRADPCPTGATGEPCDVERVTVDPCRGLAASTGEHVFMLTEQL